MNFPCTMTRQKDGGWTIRHAGTEVGPVEVTAPSRDQALDKMRKELRYRLELCPCTGEQYKDLQIDLTEEPR
ncbi:MAG TPA: hypothetical protein VKU82_02030 [Planctomycetaceae bacterium]|nr:hypothetical protein [Planctomycetaceae bacterium]